MGLRQLGLACFSYLVMAGSVEPPAFSVISEGGSQSSMRLHASHRRIRRNHTHSMLEGDQPSDPPAEPLRGKRVLMLECHRSTCSMSAAYLHISVTGCNMYAACMSRTWHIHAACVQHACKQVYVQLFVTPQVDDQKFYTDRAKLRHRRRRRELEWASGRRRSLLECRWEESACPQHFAGAFARADSEQAPRAVLFCVATGA